MTVRATLLKDRVSWKCSMSRILATAFLRVRMEISVRNCPWRWAIINLRPRPPPAEQIWSKAVCFRQQLMICYVVIRCWSVDFALLLQVSERKIYYHLWVHDIREHTNISYLRRIMLEETADYAFLDDYIMLRNLRNLWCSWELGKVTMWLFSWAKQGKEHLAVFFDSARSLQLME